MTETGRPPSRDARGAYEPSEPGRVLSPYCQKRRADYSECPEPVPEWGERCSLHQDETISGREYLVEYLDEGSPEWERYGSTLSPEKARERLDALIERRHLTTAFRITEVTTTRAYRVIEEVPPVTKGSQQMPTAPREKRHV